MLNERENYMRMMRGEVPEYVPYFSFMYLLVPSCYDRDRNPDFSGFDMFGVEWQPEEKAAGGAVPKPGKFLIDDITKWRDIVKKPDYSDVNWELMAKKDIEARPPDWLRLCWNSQNGFFQSLTNFMGFENGLIACYTDPDEVKALMEFLLEVFSEHARQIITYYKPDMYWFADDVAHAKNTFMSKDVYLELFAPYWRRFVKIFIDEGIPVQHHDCGHVEDFIPEIVDMGISAWDPAQTINDLKGIKEKYGRKLAIVGGIESNGLIALPQSTEEEVRSEVRRVMHELAPGGGYAFFADILGAMDDAETRKRNALVYDEYEKNRMLFY